VEEIAASQGVVPGREWRNGDPVGALQEDRDPVDSEIEVAAYE